MSDTSLVKIRGLQKQFGDHVVLDGVDLDVHRGEAVFVIGPSGSGKSTMLRCVNALEPYQGGEVWVGDHLVGAEFRKGKWFEASPAATAKLRGSIGMVFQRFNLFPNMTALDNVTAGLRLVEGMRRGKANAIGMELLERVGLADKAQAYPGHLSGGQQQRVAIARAIAVRPELILFDEPTSALDPELVGEVLEVIRSLAADGLSMMVVTHEIAFALEVADVVHFIDGGKIVESGPPDQIVRNPQQERTKLFLSRIN